MRALQRAGRPRASPLERARLGRSNVLKSDGSRKTGGGPQCVRCCGRDVRTSGELVHRAGGWGRRAVNKWSLGTGVGLDFKGDLARLPCSR
jgi:hypothetical protein